MKIDMGAMKVTKTMDGDPVVNYMMGIGQVIEKVSGTQMMAQAVRMEIEPTEFPSVKQ